MEHFEKIGDAARENAGAPALKRMARERSEAALSQAAAAAENAPAEVSPWLYVAGLCVTLSGLYAVNYGREEPSFAMATYLVATFGYVVSYVLRRFRVEYDSLKLPALVLVGLGLFAWLSTGHSGGTGDAEKVLTDRSHAMQILCVWVALLQPFAALTDMAVLSSCVPCMSLIALVSTTSPDSEVQYSFLVFVAAATFLMVHENYLRTRSLSSICGAARSDRKLFGGQLQLAVGTVACAFLLANFVAIPMHAFGRSLSLANGWGQTSTYIAAAAAAAGKTLGSDDKTLTLATGPVAESDAVVMQVQSATPMKWRGNTFDYYTGQAFENRLGATHHLGSDDEILDMNALKRYHPVDGQQNSGDVAHYRLQRSATELPPSSMKDSQVVEQTVTMLFGGVTQCYAGGFPQSIAAPKEPLLLYTDAGSVLAEIPFPAKAQYHFTSVAASEDPNVLREASSAIEDVPEAIASHYLQRKLANGTESEPLRLLAKEITSGLTNSYDKATAIFDYLAKNCKYNLQASAAPPASDRVEYFVTVSKQGYCDSFAAAMTMLARYAGIPARVATGYLPGKPDDKGSLLVRQRDKHAWSELFFAGVGWVPFDVTEAAVDISDHSQHSKTRRVDFVAWLLSNGILPPLLVVALALLIAYVAWTELVPRLRGARTAQAADGRPATNRAVVLAYLDACSALERRGLRRTRSDTPGEFLARVRPNLASTAPRAAESLALLTAQHDRFRYGASVASPAEAQEAQAQYAALRTALARVSPKALASPEAAPQVA